MADPSLPFSLKVTEEKIDKLPDYMGPANHVDMDFPFCPVQIDGEYWVIYKNGYNAPVLRYKGADIQNTVRQPDGTATFPIRGGYILGGMWYDAETKTLYAPLHGEVATYRGFVRREVHLAVSKDKGLTWKYAGPLLKSPSDLGIGQSATTQSGLYWDGGDGDQVLHVDERGGYIYLFTNHYYWPKLGSQVLPIMEQRVARCAVADKMASGKWMKFHNGAWEQPGIGGKGSYVPAGVVTYNTCLKKYLSLGFASSIAVCDDLSKQDWTPSYNIGPYWGASGQWGLWPTDESKRDILSSGQIFFAYNFWESSPGRLFRCELGSGTITAACGVRPSIFSSQITNYWDADGSPCYGFSPLFESDDPIMARHTRRVGCGAAGNTYTGAWSEATDPLFYEGHAKMASAAGAEVTFTFNGRDIYWRAVRGPDLGKADVYLDGVLQATVDCWASTGNPLPLAFIKEGLGDGTHTIRIVVKGEKNPLSSGTAIKHMFFEVSADTYRASDCYSSVSGKNQWTNLEGNGTARSKMTFSDPIWKGASGAEVGYFDMTPGSGDAVRKWVAPHDGTIRIEGAPALDGSNADGVTVTVLKNAGKVWSAELVTPGSGMSSCDISIPVKTGDSLEFVAHNNSAAVSPGAGLEVRNKEDLALNTRDGKPLKIGSKEYSYGLGFRSGEKVIVHLPAPALRFGATIGLDAASNPKARADYSVAVRSKVLFKPDPSRSDPDGFELWQDLNGAMELTLTAGNGIDWGNAKVIQVDGRELSLSDLPIQGPRSGTSRVLWDPVVTYTK